MKTLKYIVFAFLFCLVACEKTVKNFEIEKPDPKLVILEYAYSDSFPRLYVSRNMALDEASKPYPIYDANCQLFENNTLLGELKIDEYDWYTSNEYKFSEGKTYRYEVSANGFPSVMGEFNVPQKAEVISVDTQTVWEKYPECYDCSLEPYLRFDIAFMNKPDLEEFFLVELGTYYYQYEFANNDYYGQIIDSVYTFSKIEMTSNAPYIESTIQYSGDSYYNPSQGETIIGTTFIFSDTYLDNGTNQLTLKVNMHMFPYWYNYYEQEEGNFVFLHFKAIDKNMYEYALSKGRNSMAEDNPFVEPVTVYSNIENGLGLVSGYSQFIDSIDISNQLKNIY